MTGNRSTVDETRMAEEIVSILPPGSVARLCSDERDSVRFAVDSDKFKLRSIILNRASLRRLYSDPLRSIKIEYLQRDILSSLTRRNEFRYPRLSGMTQFRGARRWKGGRLVLVAG